MSIRKHVKTAIWLVVDFCDAVVFSFTLCPHPERNPYYGFFLLAGVAFALAVVAVVGSLSLLLLYGVIYAFAEYTDISCWVTGVISLFSFASWGIGKLRRLAGSRRP